MCSGTHVASGALTDAVTNLCGFLDGDSVVDLFCLLKLDYMQHWTTFLRPPVKSAWEFGVWDAGTREHPAHVMFFVVVCSRRLRASFRLLSGVVSDLDRSRVEQCLE